MAHPGVDTYWVVIYLKLRRRGEGGGWWQTSTPLHRILKKSFSPFYSDSVTRTWFDSKNRSFCGLETVCRAQSLSLSLQQFKAWSFWTCSSRSPLDWNEANWSLFFGNWLAPGSHSEVLDWLDTTVLKRYKTLVNWLCKCNTHPYFTGTGNVPQTHRTKTEESQSFKENTTMATKEYHIGKQSIHHLTHVH